MKRALPHHCPHTLQARIACKITFSRDAWGVEKNSLFWHGAAGLCHKKSMLLQVPAPPKPSLSVNPNAKANDFGLQEQHVWSDKCEKSGRILEGRL